MLLVFHPRKQTLQSYFFLGKTRNIAIQLGLQQCCTTSCTLFAVPFYCSLSFVLYSFFGVQTSVFTQNYVDFEPLFLGIIIHFVQVWSFL